MSRPLTNTAKLLILAASIGHLIFTNIHVRALLLLEHELCGFLMFLFVLAGLVALFEATRMKDKEKKERVFTALACLLTSGIGIYLISIYRYAIANQRALDTLVVGKAVMFSMVIVMAYVISSLAIIIDLAKNR